MARLPDTGGTWFGGSLRGFGNTAVSTYDAHIMKSNRITTVASAAVSAGLVGLSLTIGAAPAHADPSTDAFLGALTDSGLTGIDPATAVSVGQQVCPMLSQQMADVAAKVSDSIGRPLGPATMFTGLAISLFCPGVVSSVANGQSPIPLDLLGGALPF